MVAEPRSPFPPRRTGSLPTLSQAFILPRSAPLPPPAASRQGSLPVALSSLASASTQPHRPGYGARRSSLRRGSGDIPRQAVDAGASSAKAAVDQGVGGYYGGSGEELEAETTDFACLAAMHRPPAKSSSLSEVSRPLSAPPGSHDAKLPLPDQKPPVTPRKTQPKPVPLPHFYSPPPPSSPPHPRAAVPPPQATARIAVPPLGVGVDLTRLTSRRNPLTKADGKSTFEVDAREREPFRAAGSVGPNRAKSRRGEQSADEIDQEEEMERLRESELFSLAASPVNVKSAAASSLPTATRLNSPPPPEPSLLQRARILISTHPEPEVPKSTGLRRIFSLSNRPHGAAHSVSSSLSSLSRKLSFRDEANQSSNRLKELKPPRHQRRDVPVQARIGSVDETPGGALVPLDRRSRRRSHSVPAVLPLAPPTAEQDPTEMILQFYNDVQAGDLQQPLERPAKLRRKDEREREELIARWRDEVGIEAGSRASSLSLSLDLDAGSRRPTVFEVFGSPAPPMPQRSPSSRVKALFPPVDLSPSFDPSVPTDFPMSPASSAVLPSPS
ncbi:hypothetical protein JCM10213_008856 [Rhodosporidiobolus nylandii]